MARAVSPTIDKFITVWEANVLSNIFEHYDLVNYISAEDAESIRDIAGTVCGRIEKHFGNNMDDRIKEKMSDFRTELVKSAENMQNSVFHDNYKQKLDIALSEFNDYLQLKF